MHCICDLKGESSWNLPPEKVKERTFATAEEAKQWFKNRFSEDKIEFTGFYKTMCYVTSWVSCNGEPIGEISEIGTYDQMK